MKVFIKTLSMIVCLCCCNCERAADEESRPETREQVSKEEKSTTEARNQVIKNREQKMAEVTQVAAKHILVESKQEATDLLKKIRDAKDGLTFEDAAKKYSKCPSKAEGGDLGFFGKNMMVKEFETAAFALNEGEISEPVETQFGWHLIKVYGKK